MRAGFGRSHGALDLADGQGDDKNRVSGEHQGEKRGHDSLLSFAGIVCQSRPVGLDPGQIRGPQGQLP